MLTLALMLALTLEKNSPVLIAPFTPSVSISFNTSVIIQLVSEPIPKYNTNVNTEAQCEHGLNHCFTRAFICILLELSGINGNTVSTYFILLKLLIYSKNS